MFDWTDGKFGAKSSEVERFRVDLPTNCKERMSPGSL
jgi:hypothetical protein